MGTLPRRFFASCLALSACGSPAGGDGETETDGGGSESAADSTTGSTTSGDTSSGSGSGSAGTTTATDTGSTTTTSGGTTDSGGTSGEETGGSEGPGECEDPASWLDRPAHEQVAALSTGQLCCAQLVAAYLDRIATIDDPADGINAMVALDLAAGATAEGLDDAPGSGGPLHCAIVAIKDNIDVADMATTAGSLAMVDNVVSADSPGVAGLRAAGALILGKTNLSEWANFRGNGSTSGWSSFGGQTKNGANPAYNPCGSSSGSAAAVRAGIVSAAVGTETSGSIVCPSSMNGVVGMKPTVGLVSRTGIVPISHSDDTAGPITKTVHDAALLLGAMAGADPSDPATANIPGGLDLDFVAQLAGASLSGKRLGYSSGFAQSFSNAERTLYNEQLMKLADAGAVMVEIQWPNVNFGGSLTTVLTYEFKADLNAYLAAHAGPGVPVDLAALIQFNDDNAATVMPYFGQELFIQSQATSGLDDPQYTNALMNLKQSTGPDGLLAVLDGDTLDAIVVPTTGPAWTTNYGTGDQGSPSSAALPAAAGYPHLTVPMGEVGGLPVGLSFIGRAWEDGEILAIGHAYEQVR